MALSGSVTTSSWTSSAGLTRNYTLSWTATQSIANNQSTISWTLSATGTYPYDVAERTLNATVAGTQVYSKTDRVMRSPSTIATGTQVVTHNTDGTASFSVAINAAVYYSTVNCTASTTFTLDTIARKSTVSATSAYVGNASTITISRASNSFTHTLTYTFGSLSGTIATKTTSTSVPFTLPTTFYAQIGSTATSKTGTITCTTYSGSTSIGTSTCSFTAKTSSSSCAPTLSPTVVDNNTTTTALTGDTSKFIKYYSDAAFTTGAAARNSATLKSQKVTCGSKSSTSASGTLSAVESATFVFSATDSRGYTTSQTVTKTLINYVKLTCSMNASITVDGVATITASGNYFNGSFGSVTNTLVVEYRYKTSDGSYGDWTSIKTNLSSNTYTATTTIEGLDYQTTYVIQARAYDKLATKYADEQSVKAMPVFDWGKGDMNINVPVQIMGRWFGEQRILWSSAWYMNATQTATLSEAISAQPNGIVLIFSYYDGSSAQDYSWNMHFVPKQMVALGNGGGHTFLMGINAGFSSIGAKYLYFTDTTITGHSGNTSTGTNSGITFNNSNYVLRYVIGV